MNAQEFCYWLQGYIELNGQFPSSAQWQQIKDHLGLVFNKQTSRCAFETGEVPPHYCEGFPIKNSDKDLYPFGIMPTC